MKRKSGFTMIELVVVVAIIGALSGIAIPMYMDNVRKTKVGDALDTTGAIKDEISTSLSKEGDLPPRCTNHRQIRDTIGLHVQDNGKWRIGSGTMVLSLPGPEPPWDGLSREDGFDAPRKSIWAIK